jgi:hypothetical protein
MKYYLYIILLIILQIVACKDPEPKYKYDWTPRKRIYTMDSARAFFIKPYIDSLNSYIKNEPLPQFLSDTTFDEEHHLYLRSDSTVDCLKKEIIDEDTNVTVLNAIIESKNPIYGNIPLKHLSENEIDYFPNVRNFDRSVMDFAKMRRAVLISVKK